MMYARAVWKIEATLRTLSSSILEISIFFRPTEPHHASPHTLCISTAHYERGVGSRAGGGVSARPTGAGSEREWPRGGLPKAKDERWYGHEGHKVTGSITRPYVSHSPCAYVCISVSVYVCVCGVLGLSVCKWISLRPFGLCTPELERHLVGV